MDPALRVIIELPLRELWNEAGVVKASPVWDVGMEEIRELLRAGRVQFLVAEVGRRRAGFQLRSAMSFGRVSCKRIWRSRRRGQGWTGFRVNTAISPVSGPRILQECQSWCARGLTNLRARRGRGAGIGRRNEVCF